MCPPKIYVKDTVLCICKGRGTPKKVPLDVEQLSCPYDLLVAEAGILSCLKCGRGKRPSCLDVNRVAMT